MSIRKTAMVAALGVALASAPVVAQSSALSVAATASTAAQQNDDDDDDDRGGVFGFNGGTVIIGIAALVAIGFGIYFAFGNEDDDAPTSP